MSFEARNLKWNGKIREFRQVGGSKPRLWQIEVIGATIKTVWGQVDGAMQQAFEVATALNVGKSNYKSPEVVALDKARRTALLKHREGYREVKKGTFDFLDAVEAEILFDNLPQNLCFYKPDNSMGASITKKAANKKVWYMRKANGLMFVIARGDGDAMLYSRRMLRSHDDEVGMPDKTWDRRFANIQGVANRIMPKNSIILGELVVENRKTGEEDFKAIQTLTKSLTDQSFADLIDYENQNKQPVFYVWDVAFWNNKNLFTELAFADRFALLSDFEGGPHIKPIQRFHFETPDAAIVYAKKHGLEGFVVVDPTATYGEKGFNFKGKPSRPAADCAKLKPVFEDDFVAIWDPEHGHGERSTKERNGQGIKSVALYQYDKSGNLVYICNVASGLSKEQINEWSDPKKFPQVWKVEYTERFYTSEGDETNALIFPRFVEVRTDKSRKECVNDRLLK